MAPPIELAGGVGVYIIIETGEQHDYSFKLDFKTTNKEAEYETLSRTNRSQDFGGIKVQGKG